MKEEFEAQFETLSKINEAVTKVEDWIAPEEYLEWRDKFEDALEGMAGDTIREQISDAELPEMLSPEAICEIQ